MEEVKAKDEKKDTATQEVTAAISAFTINESAGANFEALLGSSGAGALEECNLKFSEMSRYVNVSKLTELHATSDGSAAHLVKVKQVHSSADGRTLLEYDESDMAGYVSLEQVLAEGKLDKYQVKMLTSGLLKMLLQLQDKLKHLAPKRILVNMADLSAGAKVFAGDSFCFQEPTLDWFDASNLYAASKNEIAKLNTMTPEVVEKVLSKGVAGNEIKFRKI